VAGLPTEQNKMLKNRRLLSKAKLHLSHVVMWKILHITDSFVCLKQRLVSIPQPFVCQH